MKPQRLPIEERIPEILSHIEQHPITLVRAEPGAGKTTKLPPALMDIGPTIVLEPRRLAAKMAAIYIADQMGISCGQVVGYQVRFDQKVSSHTLLRFVTEGLFLRLLQEDPELRSFQLVVLDEFHERHLATDIALAYLRYLQQTSRPELRIIIMSATFDTGALQRYLNLEQSFSIEGKVFPVDIHYLPFEDKKYDVSEKVFIALKQMAASKNSQGHILVFLTGVQEIERCRHYLKGKLDNTLYEVFALYADLSSKEQNKVFAPSTKRKVILSTNVAETSLTIAGITGVIDAGLAKVSSFAYWSGLPTLQLQKISQSSCIQRTGRAGRLQPGTCLRLFSEHDYRKRSAYSKAAIESSDLTELILICKQLWGSATKIDHIQWLTPPPPKHLKTALETLEVLGAITDHEELTPWGKDLAKIPLHPRLASMLLAGRNRGLAREACLLAALISEDFILDRSFIATESGACDLSFQGSIFLKWCHKEDQETPAIDRALQYKKLPHVLKLFQSLCQIMGQSAKTQGIVLQPQQLLPIIFAGFPDRVAKYRPQAKNKKNPQLRSYNFCLGRGGILSPSSQVKNHNYVIALNAYEDPTKFNAAIKTQISVATAITESELRTQPHFFMKNQELNYDHSKNTAYSHHQEYYGRLLLAEEQQTIDSSTFKRLLAQKMVADWPFPFASNAELETLQQKVLLLNQAQYSHQIPDFKDEFFEYLVDHILDGNDTIDTILQRSLGDYLYDLIEYPDQELLRSCTPDKISLGSSRSFRIHYLGEQAPYVAARVQDFFGLQDTPTICEGKINLTCVLLAPNQRPTQVTQDLAGFWQGSYQEVRKELSRRYPKHDWPENPYILK